MSDTPFPAEGKTAIRPASPPTPIPSRFAPGTLIAERFRIVAPLGRGGMGEVFRADDLKLGQSVALKFLPREFVHDRARLERLHAEVRVGRQVSHPNVCRLYDIVEWEGTHFIAMEYVDGEDLASLLRRIGRLQSDKALDIARALSAGLAAAHDLGVVHRDLKPANVMIDGRGKARITDFGLAIISGEGGGFAGTPAYMSPEQLRGEQATVRSDIFALGLVLFEIFTGRQAFEGGTLEEIRKRRASTKTPSVSSLVRDIDPIVERVIARCLEDDPAARPSSAHAVIASLPGGDPLAAAIAAGETPSPEMVAAAGIAGDLRPAIAWSLFAACFLAVIALALVENRSTLYRRVALPKSTEILQERALEIADHLGYPPPVMVAGEWQLNSDFLHYLQQRKRAVSNWNMRPGVVSYVARLSPRPIRAWHAEARILADDPPLLDPGMLRVQVDPSGHLIGFAAVPPDRIENSAAKPVNWNALFGEAALDPARFHAVPSTWSAPVDSDAKLAWDGTLASAADVPLHVEAASRGSAPVWFQVVGPWDQPRAIADSQGTTQKIALAANLVLEVLPVPIGIVLAIGNLRRGRGDRRGAMRIAAFCFLTAAVANIIRADHTTIDLAEWNAIQRALGDGLLLAATAWIVYIALEPYVRRKWPRLLISWARLVSGRVRDPMVGRDVLFGALGGIALVLLAHATSVVPQWFGMANLAPFQGATSPFASVRHLFYFLIYEASQYTVAAVELVALLVFLRLLLRAKSLATLILFALATFAFAGGPAGPPTITIPYALLSAAVLTLIVTRFGLLALTVCGYFWAVLLFVTLTVDPSTWYFGRSLLTMLVLTGIVLWAAIIAIGERPLFGAPLFDEG